MSRSACGVWLPVCRWLQMDGCRTVRVVVAADWWNSHRNVLMERVPKDGVDGNNRLKVAPIKKPVGVCYLASQAIFLDLGTEKEEETGTTIDISKYKKNGKWTILPLSVIPKLSLPDLSTIYHQYLDQNIQYECKDRLRMGNITDGGWDVCADEPYRPTKDGFVYSFGINNDFSFDDAISKKYNIPVFSFDPSMNTKAHNRSNLVHFIPIGIAGTNKVINNGWKVLPLSDILKDLGHKKNVFGLRRAH
ncbi:hypothetical protein LOTGIDRAFT_175384 [Lottia gigantea]|uniref:Methyltransferase domain-containing protein n=1 Tax=Lottia gigantea TaxID=225164 RepID=V4BZQ8_LOTGI|nr:hypothetical protein LOTGIDRAFT_175384 [Lottia gigantea]ESO94644.1 hypothetical protein LOTGIDRAFT_175384 [Lottia gigantea]